MPVFVMGCHRSGTNLLYDTLLSAGGFAVYRGYLPIYKVLVPRFGKLDKIENRKKILAAWLQSKGFRRSGLDAGFVRDRVLNECRTAGDFIRITMDEIARRQGVARWAVYDPDALLHIPSIKADLPDALFVHILRDGRDIALSLKKMEGFRPFPWNREQRGLVETALYWQWTVRRGRANGSKIPADYLEIHYEELVSSPQSALKKIGDFIGQELDYEKIQQTALGRISESNSSFRAEPKAVQQNPVNRWKERLTPQEIAEIEATIADGLQDFGYELTTPAANRSAKHLWMRSLYPALLDTKFFLKIKTPFGRFANLSVLETDAAEGTSAEAES